MCLQMEMLLYFLLGLLLLFLVGFFFYWCFSSHSSSTPATSVVKQLILHQLVTGDIDTLSDATLRDVDVPENFTELNEKEKAVIQNGYPVWKKGYLYYSRSQTYRHIVPYYAPVLEEIRRHRIPANIFQGFNHRVLHDDYYHSMSSTISLNPTYHYYFYDTHQCREFLREFFSSDVLEAYDTLIPGAYRSDLWRLCVLYVHGGVYMDLKLHPTHGFNDIIDEDADFVMAVEEPQSTDHEPSMLTSFLASTPRHPFLLATINAIIDRVKKREMGKNEWDVTGPILYARVMSQLYGWPVNEKWPEHGKLHDSHIQISRAQWYPDLMIYYHGVGKIKLRIPETNNENRFSTMTPEPYYRILWKENKIYHENGSSLAH